MKSSDLHKKICELENDLDARRHLLSPKTIEQIEDRITNLTTMFLAAVDREMAEARYLREVTAILNNPKN